jgi:hypothetical protein
MTAVDRLCTDLSAIFSTRLVSLVVYGGHPGGTAARGVPIHTLALVDGLSFPDLDACGRVSSRWMADGLAVPLIINRAEFARSLDVFPFEFGAIIDTHTVVHGPDPFEGLSVSNADLRRACEVDLRGHLLHLREAYIERHGELEAVADLVESSAPALRTLVANVVRLEGRRSPAEASLSTYLARALGPAHERALTAVLSMTRSSVGASDAARLFPDYLAAVEALAVYVDAWK